MQPGGGLAMHWGSQVLTPSIGLGMRSMLGFLLMDFHHLRRILATVSIAGNRLHGEGILGTVRTKRSIIVTTVSDDTSA